MYDALGYDQFANVNGVVNLDDGSGILPGVPPGADTALIVVEDGSIRWMDAGGDPTAAIGMPINSGGEFEYDGRPLKDFKFFAAGATVNVAYYKARRPGRPLV